MNIITESFLSRASVLVATCQGDRGKCSTKPLPVCRLGGIHHIAGGKEFPWEPSPTTAVLVYTEEKPESNFSEASFANLLAHNDKADYSKEIPAGAEEVTAPLPPQLL